jgi:hypothetical protein
MYDDTAARQTLAPAVRTNGTVTGNAIDARGYQVAMVIVSAGAITDGTQTIAVQDSDDGSTNWQPYAGQTQGSVPTLATAQQNAVYRLALDTIPRRYLRVNITVAGATTGGAVGATILLHRPLGDMQVT